jgi:glutathione S-transferase
MALIFHCGSGSPFAWRVWLALESKGVPHELRMISFSARDHKTPDYLAVNPRGRVPAIEHDGFALYESAAMLEYLDECFPQAPRLFPGDARQRALIRRLVLEADQYFADSFDALWSIAFGDPTSGDNSAIAAGRERFASELPFWESAGAPFIAGTEAPTAADFTLYPHLALALRIDRRRPEWDLHGLLGPRMIAWKGRMEALPCFERTIPPHWKT